MNLHIVLIALAAGFVASVVRGGVTPGWENICRDRKEFPSAKVLWRADLKDVSYELRDGAEGSVTVGDGIIRIVKTNSKGRIVVKAPSFPAGTKQELRLFCDVSAFSSSPDSSYGFVCGYGDGTESLHMRNAIDRRWFGAGGEYMWLLINSAPGMTYRKYGHVHAGEGNVTPALVVHGSPSRSEWRNWTAEDLASAQTAWDEHWNRLSAKDRSADMTDETEFLRGLSSDIDHEAAVETVNGVSRLVIDGTQVPPVAFKEKCSFGPGSELFTYSGNRLNRSGLKLSVISVSISSFPGYKGFWSETGFDVDSLVEHVKNRMRATDGSCIILSIGCTAPLWFMDSYPDEVWRRVDGSVVKGDAGSAFAEYSSTGKVNKNRKVWPWPSYASKAWKESIKMKISEIAAALKKTGLSKRIVGFHFYGYHDAQFATPFEDHSNPAKSEYAKYGAEGGKGDYALFMRQIGFRAQEEFARHAKSLFGKRMIAVRWCMAPFGGNRECSFDLTAFARSDAIDVVVPQPTYSKRLPAIAQGPRLPTSSFHHHGKLMWYEFDLRTWAALELWGQSVLATKGLGQADDFPMWQTIFRKHAGIMIARRMGWWFYDMGGGWFTPESIVEDVKTVLNTMSEMQRTPPDPWVPSVAIVIDEEALACYNSPGHPAVKNVRSMVLDQWPRLSASGVPYDVWLAEDAMNDQSWMTRYKAVVLSGFLKPEGRRKEFVDELKSHGVAVHITQPGGFSPKFFHDFVKDAGGYVATDPGVQVDMNGNFASVHCLVPGKYDFNLPFPCRIVNLKDVREELSADGVLPLNLTAGETCWFRIYRK